MRGKIVIVDDNKPILDSLRIICQSEFDQVICLNTPDRLPMVCMEQKIDVALLDMNFGIGHQTGQQGLYWLGRIQELKLDISVVLITAYGEVDLAVEALKRGATDFITKPWSNEKMIATLKSAAQIALSKRELKRSQKHVSLLKTAINKPANLIIGDSPAMSQVTTLISKVAKTNANVLILGENGTGKELVARQIHAQSERKHELLVSVDLGSIPSELFESELFGHNRGAFTGASETRIGKFEAASEGSLFLDEIANLPIHLQPKLLAALQNREITRLGSNDIIPINIRLISATNQDPEHLVSEGLFREDLLYRINTIVIQVPPLRQRGKDILILADYFLKSFAEKYRKPQFKLDESAQDRLLAYPWPGNVRELEHSIERAVILSDHTALSANSFHFGSVASSGHLKPDMTLDEMEKNMIHAAIERCNGNMTEAARQLGVTRQTLYNKIKKSEA